MTRLRMLVGTAAIAAFVLLATTGSGAASSAGTLAPTAAAGDAEGWTSFSHWQRHVDGSVTTELYPVPAFSRSGGSWHKVTGQVNGASGDAVATADELVRPVRFGADPAHLLTLDLDGGHVTMSAPGLVLPTPPLVAAGSVLYHAVAPSTELRYRVSPGALVEELVLTSAVAPTSFTFHIGDPSHALGTLGPDGAGKRFSALIDGDVQVGLAAPFAYEEKDGSTPAKGVVPGIDLSSAHMTVTSSGDGWDVTESIDPEWLKGKSYPIVLDPTMTFTHAAGTMVAGSLLYIPSGCGGGCSPNTVTSDLSAGTYTDSTYDYEPARSIFRFDLSSIPQGSQIARADLGLYTIACIGNPNGGIYYCSQHDYTVELHKLNGPWTTSSTYDQIAPLTDSSAFSSLYQPAFSSNYNPPCTGCFWETYDLTSQTQAWVNAPASNYGFVAKLQTEPYSIGGPYWSYLGSYGGGNGYPAPYLTVTYTANAPDSDETLGGWNPSEPGIVHCSATNYPVDCATGDFYHSFSDLAIPGRGIALDLQRTYNSLAADVSGPFGYGWTSSYDMSLSVDSASGDVTIVQENGSEVTFAPAAGGSYTAPPRVAASLTKNADGTFTFTRRERQRFTFDTAGHLTAESDLNGETTRLSYDGGGRLSTVTDSGGRTFSYSYAGNGDIASVADSAGRSVAYGYDSAGNLVRVTDATGETTNFGYDADHRLLTMTDPRGGTTTNAFDSAGRVTAQIDPMGRRTSFEYDGATTTVTDPNANREIETYSNGTLSAVTRAAGTPQAATWTYSSDSPTLAATSITDPNGHTVHYSYDDRGNVLSTTDALGRTTRSTYDALDDLTSVTDPSGHTASYTYDGSGNLLDESRPVTETGATARTSYAHADAAHPGDVTSLTDPSGGVWSYAYDRYGNRNAVTDPLGHSTTAVYDALSRRTSTVTAKGNEAGPNPNAFATTYTYDELGDLLTVSDPLGSRVSKSYDASGNLVATTDAKGHTTRYVYNADDELTAVTRASGSVTHFDYDGNGNRIAWTDGDGNVTHYAYDPLDRQSFVTDPLGRRTSAAYDGVGNLLTLTNPDGQTTSYSYDAADERTAIGYSDGSTPGVTFTYTDNGELASETSSPVTRTYRYDSLNRLAATSETDLARTVGGSALGVGRELAYGYDLSSRLTSLALEMDTLNLATVTRRFSRGYDRAGNLASVSDGLGNTTSFTYDANRNVVSENYPNGIRATYSYDNADRLTLITDTNANGVSFLNFPYGRDAAGLVTSGSASGTAAGPSLSFGYDAADRLTAATAQATGTGHNYTYDAADNRTSWATPGGSASFTYDQAAELTTASLHGLAGTSTARFAYDSSGNRTSETDDLGNEISFAYDQANRLVGANGPIASAINRQPGAPIYEAAYRYDAEGLRNDLTWDLADGMPLIVGDLTESAYLTGPDGLPVEKIDALGGIAFYHHDQLGSTRALTDTHGAVLIAYSYDPYGNVAPSGTAIVNPFLYAGQYTDPATGLIYMRARWYDPATAQFISADPAASTSNEIYAYADDDPVNNIDPTGLCSDGGFRAQSCSTFGTQHPNNYVEVEIASRGSGIDANGNAFVAYEVYVRPPQQYRAYVTGYQVDLTGTRPGRSDEGRLDAQTRTPPKLGAHATVRVQPGTTLTIGGWVKYNHMKIGSVGFPIGNVYLNQAWVGRAPFGRSISCIA
jgi:RHS repeat-associated protein